MFCTMAKSMSKYETAVKGTQEASHTLTSLFPPPQELEPTTNHARYFLIFRGGRNGKAR